MSLKKQKPRIKNIKSESVVPPRTANIPIKLEDPVFGVSDKKWLSELKENDPVLYNRLLNWD